MNYTKLFEAVKADYSEEIALGVCLATVIHCGMKIKKKDLETPGRFAIRLEKKIRDRLYEFDDVDLIVDIESCVYDWDVCQVMDGVGGCEAKSFKELVDEKASS